MTIVIAATIAFINGVFAAGFGYMAFGKNAPLTERERPTSLGLAAVFAFVAILAMSLIYQKG